MYHAPQVHAAGSIITVDTNADNATGGDHHCTLREAINNVNSATDTTSGDCVTGSNGAGDTIDFAIPTSTTASYTLTDRDGHLQKGYTIAVIGSALPGITKTVTIDGYSQTGAQTNNNPSPLPLNGTLLVQLDGTSAGSASGLEFLSGSDGSAVRGLVLGNFSQNGVDLRSTGATLQGNYIGTNQTGKVAATNNTGITGTVDPSHLGDNARIGGTAAADRNLLSGNDNSALYPASGWTVQGNYIGVDATGQVAIGNGNASSGAVSIDDADGGLYGGDVPGAANVVSGNFRFGFSPDHSSNLTIQGNLIGTDYTGLLPLGNGNEGIGISSCTNILVGGTTALARNIISNNGGTGHQMQISISGLGAASTGVKVENNYIGTDINGHIASNFSNYFGILVDGAVHSSTIGGSSPGEGNLIADTTGAGVAVLHISIQPSTELNPNGIAILGNSIYDIHTGDLEGFGLASGNQGIDSLKATLTSMSHPVSITDAGPNPNLPAGWDPSGQANDYLNHPDLTSFTQNGTAATASFDLNVAGATTTQYRVEFFSNDTSTAGQGQTYLGSATVASGSGQTAAFSLPTGTNLTNKFISATVTQINDPATNGGFGDTSEFSATPVKAAVLAVSTPGAPNTGLGKPSSSVSVVGLLGLSSLTVLAAYSLKRRAKRCYVYSRRI